MATRALWYTHGITAWHRGHGTGQLLLSSTSSVMKQMWLSSAGAMVTLQSPAMTEAVPDTLVKATCRGEGYPVALVWSCLLWEDFEPRFGTQRCHYLEASVLG